MDMDLDPLDSVVLVPTNSLAPATSTGYRYYDGPISTRITPEQEDLIMLDVLPVFDRSHQGLNESDVEPANTAPDC